MRFLLLVLLLPFSALATPALEPVVNAQIDALVRPFVAKGEFSGVVLVQDGDRALHFQHYGLAVREYDVPNQLDSAFRVGSITKQFTAAEIMHLQEQGLLHIDDLLSKYLPVPDAWKEIRIRHLLTHTSGLPGDFAFDDKSESVYHSIDELFALAKGLPLASAPGEHFLYSNVGFTTLAYLIQTITQKEYPEVVEETLRDQLGLAQTGPDHDSLITPKMSQGYSHTPLGDTRNSGYDLSNLFGAGEIRSSALDLSKWVDILLGNKFLSAESRALMWSPQVQMENEGQKIPGLFYGFGWTTDHDAGGRVRVAHNGSVPGYVADLAIWPNENKRVIVLSNVRNIVWNADHTQLVPSITSSVIRMQIEKALFAK